MAIEDFVPQVVGFQSHWIDGIARAAHVALVERQEHGLFARNLCAEQRLALVNREVGEAAPHAKQRLMPVAAAILLRGVLGGLLGQVVLQLKGD